jgi:hypothetical protein
MIFTSEITRSKTGVARCVRLAENRTPFAIAFVRSQDDAAPFIAGADELKENSRTQLIQWQITHFVA